MWKMPLLAFLSVGLSGCSAPTFYDNYKSGNPLRNVPYKQGITSIEQQRDVNDCQIEAVQRVPQRIVAFQNQSYTSPIQTNCNSFGYQTSCLTSGGQVYGGGVSTFDANSGLRIRAFGLCLVAKGYSFVNIPACPRKITSSNLDKSETMLPFSTNTCYLATPDGHSLVGNIVN